jgi:hypothetical protein
MIILLPGNVNAFKQAVRNRPDQWGWFITPRRSMSRSQGLLTDARWAADNECYTLGTNFDPGTYIRFLQRTARRWANTCLFATAPDIVADAQATLDKFTRWSHLIHSTGLPVALVAQDGLEHLTVPWSQFEALFIGGTTKWKLGQAATQLINEAHARNKWVHVGRVNSQTRLTHCIKLGVNSVDGTEWAINPGRGIRWATRVMETLQRQLPLPIT